MSENERGSIGDEINRLADERFRPQRGVLRLAVARPIDHRPCEPFRPEDCDWGEVDRIENVPVIEYEPRHAVASEHATRIGPVQEDPGWPARYAWFRQFQQLLDKRYPTEKLADIGAKSFTAELLPMPAMPWWRRLRGMLRWWWLCIASIWRRAR